MTISRRLSGNSGETRFSLFARAKELQESHCSPVGKFLTTSWNNVNVIRNSFANKKLEIKGEERKRKRWLWAMIDRADNRRDVKLWRRCAICDVVIEAISAALDGCLSRNCYNSWSATRYRKKRCLIVAARANASIKIRKNRDAVAPAAFILFVFPYTSSSINNVLLMIYGVVSRSHCDFSEL